MKASSRFLRAVSAAAVSACLAFPASVALQILTVAQVEAAVVRSIEVRGNRRVDAETIRGNLGIEPGRSFSGADIDNAVKRLFSTGLFSDVRINQVGSRLIVEVDEYAIVNQVLFQGNRKIKDEVLATRVQLQPRGAFSNATMELDVETIRESYRRIGRSDAIVNARTIEVGESRVNVVFEIQEGGRTQIEAVDFVGNNAYSDRRLRGVISTKESTFLSFLFRDDVYDQDRLRADEEALRRFYFNRGYADFRVIDAYAELDDGENEYTVTISVDEGERYAFGPIAIESTVPGIDAESLRSLVETREGNTYSAKDVEDTIIALSERVAELGYAFAQVTPRGDRDFSNRTIGVVYTIDQGPRTYVERIEIRGNTRTRDYVIRREFDVSEGDAFNQVLIRRAKRRLEDLDFFETVNISTSPGSAPDQVVLVVNVKEKSTGEFSIGAGYSTGGDNPGPRFEVSVSERNFLGRGQFIRVAAGGGEDTRDFSISFTEPYFLGRRIAAGFDLYRNTREYQFYDSEIIGGSIRFGLPITEAVTAQVAYNYSQERYNYNTAANTAPNVCPGAFPAPCPVATATQQAIALSPWAKSSVSASLIYNTIDNVKDPREGIYAIATAEFAGVGGDARFYKVSARANYFRPISDELDVIGVLIAGGGHIGNSGGTLRQFDLFRASDRIVRGFDSEGFGPADGVVPGSNFLGGTTYLHASAEVRFPVPVLPDSIGLKGALFADIGTLYGNPLVGVAPATTTLEWRSSLGVGVIWNSPFGPLRVNYAVPVMKQPWDDVQEFSFDISGRF